MRLNLAIYDSEGRTRGTSRIAFDFGSKTWSLEEETSGIWTAVNGFSKQGSFEVKGSDLIWIFDQPPGQPQVQIAWLSNVPTSESGVGNAGTGKIVQSKSADFKNASFFWTFVASPMSAVRTAMLNILIANVPRTGLNSNMAAFESLTGFTTATLKSQYWDVEGSPNRNFTTCNAFLGRMAGKLGAKPGTWLSKGVLELQRADRDVPGSWIEPSSGKTPKPGDYYSVPLTLENGWVQKFGHVGIIGEIKDGNWTSVDGGQGGRKSQLDWIKWVPRGVMEPSRLNGWIDIDLYFK